jgi:hypothetical protein
VERKVVLEQQTGLARRAGGFDSNHLSLQRPDSGVQSDRRTDTGPLQDGSRAVEVGDVPFGQLRHLRPAVRNVADQPLPL